MISSVARPTICLKRPTPSRSCLVSRWTLDLFLAEPPPNQNDSNLWAIKVDARAIKRGASRSASPAVPTAKCARVFPATANG